MPSERYEIRRSLGAGAFGEVSVAWDREGQRLVALKRLVRVDAAAIYRFKQEFRTLADFAHPNLVRLHELHARGDEWFFTMDYVDGVPFDRWVRCDERGAGEDVPTEQVQRAPTGKADPAGGDEAAAGGSDQPRDPRWEPRLRATLGEIADGVTALHGAGMLHRDLKPSNVLVTRAGQVRILDFGLVATLTEGSHRSLDQGIRGTPAYMSPEQAAGERITPASDWYSVGVMLYEALCGRLPFVGSLQDLLVARRLTVPRDPRERAEGLPDDLSELCMRLLAREPEARPAGEAIRAALPRVSAATSPMASPATSPALSPVTSPLEPRPAGAPPERAMFVGRAAELEELGRAFDRTREGKAVVVSLQGVSGIGKSALVRRFLDQRRERDEAVILEGRCYDRESVPFKAFDGIIDSLTQHLRGLPAATAAGLMPRDPKALARLFPVFGRLEVVASFPDKVSALYIHELRRRAFEALREIFARMADGRPLIAFIDDTQWSDADSAALLQETLAPPDPPPILLLVSRRGAPTEVDPLLAGIRRKGPHRGGAEVRNLAVAPLPLYEAERLAQQLLAESGGGDGHASAIARESGGSPFFIHELLRAVRGGRDADGDVSLQRVLAERIGRLPESARRLLELIAAAGRPVALSIIRGALGVSSDEEHAALARLREESFVRTSSAGPAMIEVQHDRIRETALAGLDEDATRERHARLGAAFEQATGADPEVLARHFAAGGDVERTARYGEEAGDRAADKLALDQSVALYRMALGAARAEAVPRLTVKLADALARAGRGPEAARTFVAAAESAEPRLALELRRRAGEQLLRSGYVDEGLEIMRPVLAAAGLRVPGSSARALASLLFERGRIRLRGHGSVERDELRVDPEELRRIDLCWSVGNGLGGIDLLRSADFQARHLWLAVRAGEPYRVARALSWEAILSALEGKAGVTRGAELAAHAEEIAQRIGHPHALGWAAGAGAVVAWVEGRWKQSSQLCEYATALFRERCADISWEVGSLEIWFNLTALYFRGELEEVARRAPACAREADERGDRYTSTTVRIYVMPLLWLAADDPDKAREEALTAIAPWSRHHFHLQHWAQLLVECYVDLYRRDGTALLARIAERRAALEGAMQLRIQNIRLQLTYLHGSGVLALGPGPQRARLLGQVDKDARALAGEKNPWAAAYGAALRAGAAAARGLRDEARSLFVAARGAFEALDMPLFAAACERRVGELAGGEGGRRQIALADAAMSARGVVAPARFADLLVPSAN